jgi:MFS family permease
VTGLRRGGHRRYGPLVALEAATLLSAAGNGVALVTFPWIVLELGGSAADVGLVAAAAAVPLAVSAFVSGTIVDRVGRRRTSIASDVLSALSVAAVPVAASLDVLSLGVLTVLAATGAVFDPAGVTARETMLPEAAAAARLRLERVNGVHEAIFGVAYLVGPGLGGLLIALVGAHATLWVTAAAFACSALVLLAAHVPGAGRPSDRHARASFWRESLEGLRFVWDDPTLRTLTILFTVLVGAWVPIEGVVLPVWFEAQDAPERLGALLMAMSGGGAVGALLYGAAGHRLTRWRTAMVGLVGTSLAAFGMSLLPPYPALLVLGVLTGLCYGPINPISSIALQERAPARLRGRAVGILTSLAFAAGPLGFVVVGPLIDVIGLRPTFVALSLVLVGVALVAPFARSLRGLDDPPQVEAA